MSHTNLSAAEIALLDLQLPDIGGAIRGKPVTPDGGRLAGGQVVLCLNPQRVWPASLRVATGAPALVAVAARSARRPARAPIPAAAARDPVLTTLLSGRAARRRRRRQSLSPTPTIINLKGVFGQWAR